MSNNTVERVRVLAGHTSPETAYLVEDYPYGRVLRCQIRYWIETASKGAKKGMQRFVRQTTNPKVAGEPWNKPHAGQYAPLVFLYLDGDDYVQHIGVSEYGIDPHADARLRLMGIYEQMSTEQRARYDALLAVSRRYEEPWQQWEATIAAMAEHIRSTGEDPVLTNGLWEWPAGRAYVTDHNLPVYVTAARQQLTAEQ
ncbi:hypothetical protein ACTOB_007918 [Actinoplanes oblitus]|uniref:Uncharacterized protein n=1 Tax=Actinoplanes oblitus TaxID=3040509 RepID=A0ABY8WD35_9ACTN|nr:hypothetical protein [Actinoplanes oblitus]WIM95786.1 hypothetical protein ACTOB_007918 [Actinoplanes oblitus]